MSSDDEKGRMLLVFSLDEIVDVLSGTIHCLEDLPNDKPLFLHRAPDVDFLAPSFLCDYEAEIGTGMQYCLYRSKETGNTFTVAWVMAVELEHIPVDDSLFYDLFDESVAMDFNDDDYPWFCIDPEKEIALYQRDENSTTLRIKYSTTNFKKFIAVGDRVFDYNADVETTDVLDVLCFFHSKGLSEFWLPHLDESSPADPKLKIEGDEVKFITGDLIEHPEVIELNKDGKLVSVLKRLMHVTELSETNKGH